MTIAIILAAGMGSRLHPLTKNIPKCLVKFNNKSLLHYQIDLFKKKKINQIYVITGYKSKKIKSNDIIKIYNKNYKNTNMVSSLFTAKEIFKKNEDIIVSYGDIIFSKKNFEKLLKNKNDISLMIDKEYLRYWKIRMKNPLKDLETLKLNKHNFIIELGKKTKTYKDIMGQYTGLIKINKRSLNKILDFYESLSTKVKYDNNNFKNMYMTSFLQLLINEGWKIKAVKVKNQWLEFDSFNDLNIYKKLLKSNRLKNFFNFDA